jgi:hypothetical protein
MKLKSTVIPIVTTLITCISLEAHSQTKTFLICGSSKIITSTIALNAEDYLLCGTQKAILRDSKGAIDDYNQSIKN